MSSPSEQQQGQQHHATRQHAMSSESVLSEASTLQSIEEGQRLTSRLEEAEDGATNGSYQILEEFVKKILAEQREHPSARSSNPTRYNPQMRRTEDAGLEEQVSSSLPKKKFSFLGQGISRIDSSLSRMWRDGVRYNSDDWDEVRDFFCHDTVNDLSYFYNKDGHRYVMELFRKRPPKDIVEKILEHWPTEHHFPMVNYCRDSDGKTILHHAIENGASFGVVEAIISKDQGTVGVKDNDDKYPLTAACIFASANGLDQTSQMIIKLLTDNGRALSHEVPPVLATIEFDEISDDVFLEMILKPGGHQIGRRRCKNTGQLPVQIAIMKESRGGDVIAFFMKDDRFKLKHMSALMLERLAHSAATSRQLQQIINDATSRRWQTAILFLEFYSHMALVGSFVYAAEKFVLGEKSDNANITVVALSVYFAIRELYQVKFHSFNYFIDIWNWIDLTRISLALASAISLFRAKEGANINNGVRTLLLTTGAFVVAGLVLFLRSTFLPFAEFVGGLITIVITLGPFVFVSVLVVFSFAFMFFMLGFDDETCAIPDSEDATFCQLNQSILTTFNFFYSGPDQTSSWMMDIIFGLVVVVILLNVVIAIVSDAWEESKKRIGVVFWTYKLDFLAEVESLSSWSYYETRYLPRLLLHGRHDEDLMAAAESTTDSSYGVHCFQQEEGDAIRDLGRLQQDITDVEERKAQYLSSIKGIDQQRDRDGRTTRKVTLAEVEQLDQGLDDMYRHFRERFETLELKIRPIESERWESDAKANIADQHEKVHQQLNSLYYGICDTISTLDHIAQQRQVTRNYSTWTMIDSLGKFANRDRVNWNEKPYVKWIKTSEDYYKWVQGLHPQPDGMSKKVYNDLSQAGSWERNWYWACKDAANMEGPTTKTRKVVAVEFGMYLCVIVLGFFTFGIFWPESVRKHVFSVSTEDKLASLNAKLEKNKREVLKNTEYLAEESLTETEAKLASLEDQFLAMTLKLDAVLNIIAES